MDSDKMHGGFFRYDSRLADEESSVLSDDDSHTPKPETDDCPIERRSIVLYANFEEKELWCDLDRFEERRKNNSNADTGEEEEPSSNAEDETVSMADLALKADQKDSRCLHRGMSRAEFAIRERIMSVLRFFEPVGAVDHCTLYRKRFVRVSGSLLSRSYKIDG